MSDGYSGEGAGCVGLIMPGIPVAGGADGAGVGDGAFVVGAAGWCCWCSAGVCAYADAALSTVAKSSTTSAT